MTSEAFAPAKINLTLHVTGRRADGYHLLDSLVVFAAVGDRLWLAPGDSTSIRVTGPFAGGVPTDARNLVWRAADAAGFIGGITLEKNLPHGAGIGGGSADAAALLRALSGDDAEAGIGLEAALALGADVPVCLHEGPQRMAGIGENLSRIAPVPRLDIVLVNPRVHVATPQVFAALESADNRPMEDCDGWTDLPAFVEWLNDQRNDLEPAACTVAPAIRDALTALRDAPVARMSGSGATCFGVFESQDSAREAAERIARDHPDWWVVPTRTTGAS